MQKKPKPARIAIIGEPIEVVEAKNLSLNGIRGQVVDETKNTIIIKTDKGTKTMVKDQITIKINNKTINGKKLSGRIEMRIKQ